MQILHGTCSDLQLHTERTKQPTSKLYGINNSKTYVSYHQNLNKKILKIKIWFLEHPKGPRDVGSLRDVVRAGHVTCTSRHAHAIKTVALPNTFLIITEQYCTQYGLSYSRMLRVLYSMVYLIPACCETVPKFKHHRCKSSKNIFVLLCWVWEVKFHFPISLPSWSISSTVQ